MASSPRISLVKLLSESILIIFSISLAFLLNEWRSNYQERQRTENLLHNLHEELESNREVMQKLIPYHQQVLSATQEAFRHDTLLATFFGSGYFQIYQVAPRGIFQGSLKDIAYEVAKQDHLTNRIPFSLSAALSVAYEQQELVQGTRARLITLLSSREMQRRELIDESIILFAHEINELYTQEKDLDYYYSLALEQLAALEP